MFASKSLSLRGDERGGAAIEFAILAPIYLMLLAGMLAYGIYFGAAHSLQQLAADAARVSIAGLDTTERNNLVRTYLTDNAGGYVLINPQKLAYAIGDKPGTQNQYLVTLRYNAEDLPIWNLYLPLPLPSREIAYSATIRTGGL